MTYTRKISIGVSLLLVIVFGGALPLAVRRLRKPNHETLTVYVKRGTVDARIYVRGELRARRDAVLLAPPVGGRLQIVHLAKTGTRVQAGEVVVQFNPAEQEHTLEQSRSELERAEQEIVKAKADAAVQVAQDQVALLKARFDVRRAELDVSKNELVSAIDAKKNLLALEEAKRRLAQLEQDTQSRAISNQASLAVSEEKRNKAQLSMQQAQKNIEQMRLTAAIGGLVAVKENFDIMGGMMFGGMTLPDYHEGDQVQPGRTVAEVHAVEEMEAQAKVNEADRAYLEAGQPVEIRVDGLAGKTFNGKLKTMATVATKRFWDFDTARQFDVIFGLDEPDLRIRPGVSAEVIILGEAVKDALFLPRQALFEKEGRPVVYVKTAKAFEQKEVKIVRRTEAQIVIDGLAEGTEVALVNPEEEGRKPTKTGSLLGIPR
jgi:multidrug efflux pump subunit AcrA (membrane-fusion protein)